jgi:hypothetical protein
MSGRVEGPKMNPEELQAFLLTPEGFAFFRQTIIGHYSWLIHDAHFDNLDSIRNDGPTLNNPSAFPAGFVKTGGNVNGIICLNPLGSATMNLYGRRFRVALRSIDLPEQISLDWSYPDN